VEIALRKAGGCLLSASAIAVLIVAFALSGCATDRSGHSDHHVLKCDRIYDRVISDPYEWALQQFADGPITVPHVRDYARLVLADGLQQAVADLGNDGTQELFPPLF